MGCQCTKSLLGDDEEVTKSIKNFNKDDEEEFNNIQPNMFPYEQNDKEQNNYNNYRLNNKINNNNTFENENINPNINDYYQNNQNQERDKENDFQIEYHNSQPNYQSSSANNNNNQEENDYPIKMLNLINQVRQNPSFYADIIEKNIEYIIENHQNESSNKNKIIFKKKIKVALTEGKKAFLEAAEKLRTMRPLPPLQFKQEICIPLPDTEEEVKDSSFLRKQVEKVGENYKIDVYFKDLVKVPEVSALLMVVDDTGKNAGKKSDAVLSENYKYIGISSKFIGKLFVAYFSFAC